MYVIYCQSGKEMAVVRQLAEKNITAYAPRRLVQERHRRRWVQREVLLFSGYVFLDAELTPDIWQAVKFCYGTLRILSRSQLSQTEEEYIRFLCNDGHALGISRGYVSGGALHIMDGFLKRFQHLFRIFFCDSVNFRKNRLCPLCHKGAELSCFL